jgi:hypothetical protein
LYGPNLTPDKQTGIGSFSEDDFRKAVREGITQSGRTLSPPMGKFKSLTDTQVHSIYVYLQSLSPVHHQVKRRFDRGVLFYFPVIDYFNNGGCIVS